MKKQKMAKVKISPKHKIWGFADECWAFTNEPVVSDWMILDISWIINQKEEVSKAAVQTLSEDPLFEGWRKLDFLLMTTV